MWISRAKSEKASREEYEEVGKMRPKCDLTLSCRMEQTSCPGSHAPTAKPSTAPPTYPGTHCVRPPTQVHIACAHLPRYILRAPTYPGTYCVRPPTQVHIASAVEFAGQVAGHGATQTVVRHVPV